MALFINHLNIGTRILFWFHGLLIFTGQNSSAACGINAVFLNNFHIKVLTEGKFDLFPCSSSI
jgi:hypothetical protein